MNNKLLMGIIVLLLGLLAWVWMNDAKTSGSSTSAVEVDSIDELSVGRPDRRTWVVFRSDQQLAPGPISSVASGGELSRLVLAIRLATTAPETETLVFDEVDAGVGGATALALGEKIADLARDSQVLCVTHLPQIAAFADSHYVVERHEAVAQVRLVAGGERVAEISRMLAGMPDSTASHETATELLAMAGGSALS